MNQEVKQNLIAEYIYYCLEYEIVFDEKTNLSYREWLEKQVINLRDNKINC